MHWGGLLPCGSLVFVIGINCSSKPTRTPATSSWRCKITCVPTRYPRKFSRARRTSNRVAASRHCNCQHKTADATKTINLERFYPAMALSRLWNIAKIAQRFTHRVQVGGNTRPTCSAVLIFADLSVSQRAKNRPIRLARRFRKSFGINNLGNGVTVARLTLEHKRSDFLVVWHDFNPLCVKHLQNRLGVFFL